MHRRRCFHQDTYEATRPSRAVRRRRCAFSLIELVIVLLIISIFWAVATPTFFDSLLFHRVETAARRVKADIDSARQRARLTSTTQTITFSGATYTSTVKSIDRPAVANSVNLTKSPFLLNSATADFGGTQTLTFNGYGTPTSGGTVVLNAKSHQCTVTVDATTGIATITSNHPGGGMAQTSGG
ncbi:MAG: type II secretion system protein [Pirellulales bacterium]